VRQVEIKINTSLPIHFEKMDDIADLRFTRVKIYLLHTGLNLNNSFFEKSIVENALPSLSNIPIVGYIQVDDKNKEDFAGHETKLVIDDNGVDIVYVGRAYGIIPETNNAKFELKTVDGIEREYLVCEGLIFNKFANAVKIFDRDNTKGQSMELYPPSIKGEWSKNGYYKFTQFMWEGACILGDGITPAMVGSTIEKFSFSTLKDELKDILDEFNKYYSMNQPSEKEVENIEFSSEGGNCVVEVINKDTVVEEVITEVTETEKVEEVVESEEVVTEVEETTTEFEKEEKEEVIPKFQVMFELSHDDIRSKLYELINPLNEEGYRDWNYWIAEVFQTYFIAENWEDSSFYKFDYTIDGDNVSLVGEKVEVEMKWLVKGAEPSSETVFSNDEIEQLRVENTQLKEFKNTREKEDKMTLLSKFSELTEEEVKTFVENIDKYNYQELELNLFALLGKKKAEFSFEQKEEKSGKPKLALSNFGIVKDSNAPNYLELVDKYKNKNK
jgi:hypothetical protein